MGVSILYWYLPPNEVCIKSLPIHSKILFIKIKLGKFILGFYCLWGQLLPLFSAALTIFSLTYLFFTWKSTSFGSWKSCQREKRNELKESSFNWYLGKHLSHWHMCTYLLWVKDSTEPQALLPYQWVLTFEQSGLGCQTGNWIAILICADGLCAKQPSWLLKKNWTLMSNLARFILRPW